MNSDGSKYVGKYILVGLTYVDNDGQLIEQEQIHGKIVNISDSTIFFDRNDNGEEFSIPFDEDNLKPGIHGAVYNLRATGESVQNVDYTSSWTIYPPQNKTWNPIALMFDKIRKMFNKGE